MLKVKLKHLKIKGTNLKRLYWWKTISIEKNYETPSNFLASKISLQYIHDGYIYAYIFIDSKNLIKNNFLFLKTQLFGKKLKM